MQESLLRQNWKAEEHFKGLLARHMPSSSVYVFAENPDVFIVHDAVYTKPYEISSDSRDEFHLRVREHKRERGCLTSETYTVDTFYTFEEAYNYAKNRLIPAKALSTTPRLFPSIGL